jgi:hypothetical protein
MGKLAAVAVVLAFVAVGIARAADENAVVSGAVGVRVADDWSRVPPAPGTAGADGDPRTVLVVGTHGVTGRSSQCQVASYRIPADGAAVVVLAWRGVAPAGLPRDRSQLVALRLKRPLFECFDGRGAVAQVVIRNRAYQVNVMVGDRATRETVADALTAARSFGAAG